MRFIVKQTRQARGFQLYYCFCLLVFCLWGGGKGGGKRDLCEQIAAAAPCQMAPDGSKRDPLLARAEPGSDTGWASVTAD